MKVTVIPIMICAFGTVTKGLLKESWRTGGDHPNYVIMKNGQNSEKSSGDLRILAVTQTYVKDHRLKLMWKNFNDWIIIIIIIIIIIMSRRQYGYPWLSLATSPYHSSPPAGLQGYILCPLLVAVCKFVLVVLLLHIHMWGSTGVHRLWARP